MEFVDLSRYLAVSEPSRIAPFSELRTMAPVLLTHDLALVETPENIAYAQMLAAQGHRVAFVRRQPPSERFVDREDFPRRVLFEMTSRCNYLCKMCPQQEFHRPRVDMPGERYREVIDELDAHGLEGIWLYHIGESLLHPEFHRNVEHVGAKHNLGVVWMSTNGRLFDGAAADTVLDSQIDFVNFSAHATTPETYATVAPTGNFEAVQENLRHFYGKKGRPGTRRPFLHVQMIEQDTTRHEVDAFIGAHYDRAEIVSVNMLEYAQLPNNAFGNGQRDRKPLESCVRIDRADCFIFSNGDVTLCDFAYNAEIKLGNVHEQSVYEIWNGPERRRLLDLNARRAMYENEFCLQCTDYDI